ncbi:MAG: adenine deaminase [Phycisphaerales bacterium]
MTPPGPTTHPDPALLAIARGDEPADLLLANARVVNVFTGQIHPANVAIHHASGRIAGVGEYTRARERIDLRGAYLAPGFVDAHMHVESTMLTPRAFVPLALVRGTTGAVFDPHEIANVLGIPGIRFLMDNAAELPFDAWFALSSCVPASHLETSGASLSAADLAPLFSDPRVVALAELMNYPAAVAGAPEVLDKIRLGLAHHVVDGHAPGLSGLALQAYAAAGINSDHECTSAPEALEKLAAGFTIFIREGSAAQNLAALLPAVTPANHHRFCFATDDRHPADLVAEGHIDHAIRKAVAAGLDPVLAIAMASINVARHYRRPFVGAIAPGYTANMVVFDDLANITPRSTYFRGHAVAQDSRFTALLTHLAPHSAPHAAALSPPVRLPQGFGPHAFRVPSPASTPPLIRIIAVNARQLLTTELREPASLALDGHSHVIAADPARDLLKLAVIERHTGSGRIGLGFVRGFGLSRGAIASTVGHDSHNLAVAGCTDADMALAARTVADMHGGLCAVAEGQVLATLPLPIAGLISDQPAQTVIARQRVLLDATRALGCSMPDPFMPLSFLPLAVIPHLKLTDHGLVDVDRFAITSLFV